MSNDKGEHVVEFESGLHPDDKQALMDIYGLDWPTLERIFTAGAIARVGGASLEETARNNHQQILRAVAEKPFKDFAKKGPPD